MSNCRCVGSSYVLTPACEERVNNFSNCFLISTLVIAAFILLANQGAIPGGITESTLDILNYTTVGLILVALALTFCRCYKKSPQVEARPAVIPFRTPQDALLSSFYTHPVGVPDDPRPALSSGRGEADPQETSGGDLAAVSSPALRISFFARCGAQSEGTCSGCGYVPQNNAQPAAAAGVSPSRPASSPQPVPAPEDEEAALERKLLAQGYPPQAVVLAKHAVRRSNRVNAATERFLAGLASDRQPGGSAHRGQPRGPSSAVGGGGPAPRHRSDRSQRGASQDRPAGSAVASEIEGDSGDDGAPRGARGSPTVAAAAVMPSPSAMRNVRVTRGGDDPKSD